MWKTFKAEVKHIYNHRWKRWEFLVLLLIPFVYGFLYMNAYWAPFNHTAGLKIAVLNLDKDSKALSSDIVKDGKTLKIGGKNYPATITPLDGIYNKNVDTVEKGKSYVKSGDYSAMIIIPRGFDANVKKVRTNLATAARDAIASNGQITFSTVEKILNGEAVGKIKAIPNYKEYKLLFYNSYKNNYLAGEMTNFASDLNRLGLKALIPNVNVFKSPLVKLMLGPLISIFEKKLNAVKDNIVSIHKIGGNIDTYGFGMAPYFISIALWAGALVMTFLFKNERHIKNMSTMKHYFGKSMSWVLTGWIQTTILMIAVTIQGVNLGFEHQWELFLFGYFMSAIFSLFVQAVSFAIRWGDIGEFVVVILLVVQLISSSGTFPVEMQHWIFKIFHPVVPFTYTISSIREIFYDPDISVIFYNMLILALFPIAVIPMSLYLNFRFDRRTKIVKDKKTTYDSFEIHMGDF